MYKHSIETAEQKLNLGSQQNEAAYVIDDGDRINIDTSGEANPSKSKVCRCQPTGNGLHMDESSPYVSDHYALTVFISVLDWHFSWPLCPDPDATLPPAFQRQLIIHFTFNPARLHRVQTEGRETLIETLSRSLFNIAEENTNKNS